MKFKTKIPESLLGSFNEELTKYQDAFNAGNLTLAWNHLERAHIIGQAYPIPHTQVHWLMLKFGFSIKNRKEIFGQIPRLLVGGVKSFVGVIPVGNTGGADVPPLRKMEIPEDIQEVLNQR